MAPKPAKKKKGSYVVPPNMMKLITLVTLLISDADVLFTVTSIYAYATNTAPDPLPATQLPDTRDCAPNCTKADPLIVMISLVGMFTFVYVGGCIIAARESSKFVDRFREKVRLNEIAGLDLEEMDLFFTGKPVKIVEEKTLESVEQEFHDKTEGKAARPNRAAKDGHNTLAMTRHDEDDEEAGEASGRPASHRRVAQTRTAKLAPTPEEAKKKFRGDPERALYLLCQHKDITFAFFRERRQFARRVVKPSHSLPLVRLMVYGWQPTVSHTDFAGILNANALYSFTIGFPQLGCSVAYIVYFKVDPILVLSLAIGTVSLILSVLNMVLDFPKQLFDIAQREGEAHVFALQAEEKSEFWTQKMEVEVQQQQEYLLQISAMNNSQAGGERIQRPLSIIGDVISLERECMRARVDYVAHQMFMSLHESERRQAIRSGTLQNPYAVEAAEQPNHPEGGAPTATQPLPPPAVAPPAAPPAPVEGGPQGTARAHLSRASSSYDGDVNA